MLKYTVQVYAGDYDDVPSHAVIKLPKGLIRRILQLSDKVKELRAYEITEFDSTPDYMVEGDDGLTKWEGRMDFNILHVSKGEFKWESCLKHPSDIESLARIVNEHTDIVVDTSSIIIAEMEEHLEIMDCKRKNLPLMIGKEFRFESSEKLFERRIRRIRTNG